MIPLPEVSIDDVSVSEGDAGTTDATFTVSLYQAADRRCDGRLRDRRRHRDAPRTTTRRQTGTLTFAPGEHHRRSRSPVAATPSLTSPTRRFFVNLSNASAPRSPTTRAWTRSTGPNDQVIDADGQAIVSGPTKAKAGSKTYSFKVTNNGTGPLTFDLGRHLRQRHGRRSVVGTVAGPTGTDTINPGKSVRYKLVWTHGDLATGLPVSSRAVWTCRVTSIPRLRIALALRGSPLAASGPRWRVGGQRALGPLPARVGGATGGADR